MGYYDCHTPAVILRNVLENPGWYTQYTPYQAEIAQGRLEALLNFQTMVADLTGLPLANASLLDEATAAAEAMTLCRAVAKPGLDGFFVAEDCHPQTIAVVRTKAEPLGIHVHVGPVETIDFARQRLFGVLVQYPATDGTRPRLRGLRRARPRRRAPCWWWRPTSSPSPCSARRASSARTWRSARPSASACRWATAGRTPPSSPRRTSTSGTCPGGSSASRRTPRAGRPSAWRSRPASSTSAATRPRATSAPRRCCWPSWPRCTRSTTGRTACGRSRGACTRWPASCSWACAGSASTRGRRRSSTRSACARRRRRAGRSWSGRGRRGSTCARTTDGSVGVALDETTPPRGPRGAPRGLRGRAGRLHPRAAGRRGRGGRSPRRTRGRTRSSLHPVFNRYHAEHEMLRYLSRLQARDLSLATR